MRTLRTNRRQLCGLVVIGVAAWSFGWPAHAQPKQGQNTVLEAEAPLGLTTSEGAGLELVSLKARAVVQEPLAFTEMQLAFRNPENRVREGRFRITLPSGAVISRFAMKVNGAWQEGEVVEKQAARRAYEDFLHRRQDPALMETEAGNEFSARIFPIPANGIKELIVSYSQELANGAVGYRLPLRGLPRLGELDARVLVARTTAAADKPASSLGGARVRQEVIEVNKRNFKPDQDLVVEPMAASTSPVLRHHNLVVARINALTATNSAEPINQLTVLFDTSASRALGFSQAVKRLQTTLAALLKRNDFSLDVLAFDQEVVTVFSGKASGFSDATAAKLLQRRAEGASDLESALKRLVDRSGSGRRLLLVTDGVATAGSTEGEKLLPAMKALATAGYVRADVMAVGGIRDDERLAALVTAGLPKAGVVLASDASATEDARRLLLSTRAGLKVEVPGAAWVWPTQLDGVQPGDEVLVYADLPAQTPLQVKVGGQLRLDRNATATTVERPLLERAWIKARLARLQHQRDTLAAGDPDLRAALAQQMVQLSIEHRVLCNMTALLVLETEQDYVRFNIDRRALANILTVGSNGIEVMSRKGAPAIVVAPAVAMTKGRAGVAPPADAVSPFAANDNAAEIMEGSVAGATNAIGRSPTSGGAPQPAPAAAPVMEPMASSPRQAAREMAEEESKADADTTPSPRGRSSGISAGGSAPAARIARDEAASAPRRSIAAPRPAPPREVPAKKQVTPALEGKLAAITALLRQGRSAEALAQALAWRQNEPGDVLAIVALGQALEAVGRKAEAARVYGSIIDLFPGRADLRRFAAGHLERLGQSGALTLAVDCLNKAAADRADHPSSHHLLAMAYLQAKQPDKAFMAIETALAQHYPAGRFAGADRVLKEDLGLAAAAWVARDPKQKSEIMQRLSNAGGVSENAASVRFVLTWETDANDVDFHIRDGRGGHAFYSNPTLPSGGQLYADVTTGYGPECFTVRKAAADRPYPYSFQAHYYSKGPMGYGLGRLQIINHDGKGGLRMESRPFVVMTDGAYLDLGSLGAAKAVAVAGKVLAVP